MNEHFNVTGMSCAACSARVEKAVSSLPGVAECSVNLLTNSMTVEGNFSPQDIISAVKKAGYGASPKGQVQENNDDNVKSLITRLVSSSVLVLILMYISMGHGMWGWPLPAVIEKNYTANGIIQMLLTITVMIINRHFFISGIKGVINKSPNMDTLVSLGSGAGFIYSIYALIMMILSHSKGENIAHYLHELYFEGSAMILAVITLGKLLEVRSKGKTTNAIKGLMALTPDIATIIRNGEEVTVSASEIAVGDIFIVKTGESIPADGIVIEGACTVNESALTGESIPKDKTVGDTVSTATINLSGFVKCEATKVGDDTLLSQIIKMVSDASGSKAPVAKTADKISGIFVPIVIAIAIITLAVWLIAGETIGFALARAISVLVISCPCALGLATPVAIMVGSGVGAKNGILYKTAIALETTGKIKTIALDKTGTITEGMPRVTDVIPYGEISEGNLISYAYSLEEKSSHPLAIAVCEYAKNTAPMNITDFNEISGHGLTAKIKGIEIRGGNERFVSEITDIPQDIKEKAVALAKQGKTPLFFGTTNEFLGIIAVADTIKPTSPQAIKELQNMGIDVVMLTGDNEETANAIKDITGVNRVIAKVLPNEKANVINELKSTGIVAMVGDGINDAPALTTADIGIAIGRGTDIAIDAADIVLIKDTLLDVCGAIRLSRSTLKNIYENLFWAFIYNIIGIPIAAGVLIPLTGLRLNPMIAATAMGLSSFFVVSNALRLNFTKIYSTKKDRKIKNKKENKAMEITLKVNGMMCSHCEAHVRKALEEIDGVIEAHADHQTSVVTVKISKSVDRGILQEAIIAQGYTIGD